MNMNRDDRCDHLQRMMNSEEDRVEAVDELGDVEPRGQGQRPHRFVLVSG